MTLGNAIQCWSLCKLTSTDRMVSVAEAATTFCLPPERIIAAVNNHPWLYLDGDGVTAKIGHDGE
jgi:hypothetical protein